MDGAPTVVAPDVVAQVTERHECGTRRCLYCRCEFSCWGLRYLLSSAIYAPGSTFNGTDRDACLEVEPVCLSQKLFDAHPRDPTSEQVAHRRLVLIQNVRELCLCVALHFHMFQDGGQELSLYLERACFRRRKTQRIEDIAPYNVCRPI